MHMSESALWLVDNRIYPLFKSKVAKTQELFKDTLKIQF